MLTLVYTFSDILLRHQRSCSVHLNPQLYQANQNSHQFQVQSHQLHQNMHSNQQFQYLYPQNHPIQYNHYQGHSNHLIPPNFIYYHQPTPTSTSNASNSQVTRTQSQSQSQLDLSNPFNSSTTYQYNYY